MNTDEREILKALESPEERAARERAESAEDSEKAGPGRPKGSGPKQMAMRAAGARALVRFCWLLSKPLAWLMGGKLSDMTDEQVKQGEESALSIIARYDWLGTVASFVGFPLWLGMTIEANFVKKPKEQKAIQNGATGEQSHITIVKAGEAN